MESFPFFLKRESRWLLDSPYRSHRQHGARRRVPPRAAPGVEMSSGTRGAAQRVDARIAELEARLLQLGGREHKAERSKVNRELWALQNQTPAAPLAVPPAISPGLAQPAGSGDTITPMQQLVAHWKLLHPASEVGMALCVRCGAGDAPSCRFHPDARAFAFGTGRFDYGYTSLWDTPHDRWFCCGGIAPECAGCCEEQNHSTDPDWWRAYDHLSPALASDRDSSGDSSSDSERSSDAAEAMSAMDIT